MDQCNIYCWINVLFCSYFWKPTQSMNILMNSRAGAFKVRVSSSSCPLPCWVPELFRQRFNSALRNRWIIVKTNRGVSIFGSECSHQPTAFTHKQRHPYYTGCLHRTQKHFMLTPVELIKRRVEVALALRQHPRERGCGTSERAGGTSRYALEVAKSVSLMWVSGQERGKDYQ